MIHLFPKICCPEKIATGVCDYLWTWTEQQNMGVMWLTPSQLKFNRATLCLIVSASIVKKCPIFSLFHCHVFHTFVGFGGNSYVENDP